MAAKWIGRSATASSTLVLVSWVCLLTSGHVRTETDGQCLSPPLDPARAYAPTFKPCLWMCCPKGQTFGSDRNCTEADWLPETMEVTDEDGLSQDVSLLEFRLQYETICPGSKLHLDPEKYEGDNFTLFSNGTMHAFSEYVGPKKFCVSFTETNRTIPRVMLCLSAPEHPPVKAAHFVYAGFLILSLPFLLATFLVYAMLPKLQNLHGKIVMSNVAMLFVAYLALICAKLGSSALSHEVCSTTAFIIYFAFLASFFWLNVMCLDIWWTFSGFRPMRGSVKEREHKKFIIYSLYCWGSPLIMLIICMVMDLHPDIPDTYIKPGFGEVKCWFRSTTANLLYFTGPTAILIVCNIVLFIFTSVKIRQVKRGTKILKKQDSRRHNEEEENNTQRFNLYLKLFLVMGVNWIMEIVSFAAGGPDEWWYVTDIANTLQGVLIFIIFVWKDRIRKLLAERFRPGRAANNSFGNSSSTRTTGIRHNGSINTRPSIRNKEDCQMKTLTSPSARSDESDVA